MWNQRIKCPRQSKTSVRILKFWFSTHGLAGVGAMLSYSKLKGYSNEKSIAAIKKIIMLYEKHELKNNSGKGIKRY